MDRRTKSKKNKTMQAVEENMNEYLYNLVTGQWFSTRDNFDPRGHSAMSEDILVATTVRVLLSSSE